MKKRIVFISGLSVVLILGLFTQAYAISDDDIVNILSTNSDFFIQNSIIESAIRFLGWTIVKILASICEQAEIIYKWTYHYITFTTGTDIESLISQLKPIYQALLALSITAVGFVVMFFGSKIPNLLKSIALSVGIITCTFFVMSQLNNALYNSDTETGLITWAMNSSSDDGTNVTNNVLRTNIYDLYYIDSKLENGLADFNRNDLGNYHYEQMTDEDVENIKVNEVMNYNNSVLSENGKTIISKAIVKAPDQGYFLTDVYNGFFWNSEDDADLGNEFYYRYRINFLECVLTLIAFIIVFICVAINVVKIVINMVVSRILGVLYSADLNGMKKTLTILSAIKDGYIALFMSAIQIRLFTLMQAWTNEQLIDKPLINAIMLVILAIAILSGPSIVERVTGYSQGVQGGLGAAYATAQAARASGTIIKGTAKVATGVGKKGLSWLSEKMHESQSRSPNGYGGIPGNPGIDTGKGALPQFPPGGPKPGPPSSPTGAGNGSGDINNANNHGSSAGEKNPSNGENNKNSNNDRSNSIYNGAANGNKEQLKGMENQGIGKSELPSTMQPNQGKDILQSNPEENIIEEGKSNVLSGDNTAKIAENNTDTESTDHTSDRPIQEDIDRKKAAPGDIGQKSMDENSSSFERLKADIEGNTPKGNFLEKQISMPSVLDEETFGGKPQSIQGNINTEAQESGYIRSSADKESNEHILTQSSIGNNVGGPAVQDKPIQQTGSKLEKNLRTEGLGLANSNKEDIMNGDE